MAASTVKLCMFDTTLGPCAIAWSRRGVCGVQLPEHTAEATGQRLLGRFPGARESAPPGDIRRVIDAISTLFDGESSDLTGVTLDESGVSDFHRRVYAVARTIAPGATLTYGEIAARLGEPGSARAVGQALGQNPYPIIVPCHRVLAAGGRAGGFSAAGGVTTKLKLLEIERSRLPFELT